MSFAPVQSRRSTYSIACTWWSAVSFCALLLVCSAVGQEPGQTPQPKSTDQLREPTEEELVRLDKDHPYFKPLEDEGPFHHRGQTIVDPKRRQSADAELKAFDYILGFASRQPIERLKKYSIKDVPVDNLFRPIKQDYLRELLHFEGKLSLILAMKPTADLKELEKVDQLYEAWVFPRGSSKLVCVVVSELPDGVKSGEDQNVWVAFDAYYFKLWHYESRQAKDKADPDKRQWLRAPMFLGRTIEIIPEQTVVESIYTPTMLISVVSGLAALCALALGIGLWFRKGDRQIGATARERIHQSVTFETPPDQNGSAN
jgi:hypothetical protein